MDASFKRIICYSKSIYGSGIKAISRTVWLPCKKQGDEKLLALRLLESNNLSVLRKYIKCTLGAIEISLMASERTPSPLRNSSGPSVLSFSLDNATPQP